MPARQQGSEQRSVEHRDTAWQEDTLLAALEAAVTALGEQAAHLDALNVFPVADRDTGTNLLLTAQAALRAARAARGRGLPAVARSAADAAFRAAHGNSGMLLSQVFRALAEALAERAVLDASCFAEALTRADTLARRALLHPVEGTMITVLRAAAEEAERAVRTGTSLPELLRRVSAAAYEATRRTPEYLPLLRERGVVDAGAQGLTVILHAWATRGAEDAPPLHLERATPVTVAMDGHGSCLNALLESHATHDDAIQTMLSQLGDSVELVRDGQLLRIHLHTERPEAVLSSLQRFGRLLSVVVDDLTSGSAPALFDQPPSVPVLVLSGAPRIVTLAHRMGAMGLLTQDGPPDIAETVGRLADRLGRLVLLPGSHVDLARARALVERVQRPSLVVLPVESLAAQLAALLLLGGEETDQALDRVRETLERLRTAEIDRLRDGRWRAITPEAGAEAVIDVDLVTVFSRTLELLRADEAAVCTLVIGERVERIDAVRRVLEERWPQVEREWFWGHQPAPALSLALEQE